MMKSPQDYFGLDGQRAMVTGAGRGIGQTVAETLAGCGATVIVSDRDRDGCEKVAAAINEAGGTAHAVEMDISEQMQIETAFAKVAELLSGRLDIMVNNAGMIGVLPLFDDRMEIWDRMYAVNTRGTFLCCREAARLMRQTGKGGRIINVSSSSAIRPVLDGIAPYSSSKGAVNTMTQGLAYDLAPHNITVNSIMPHAIRHATDSAQYEENKTPVSAGAAIDAKRYRLPMGQGEPQDIASLVAFLAGPGGRFISGQQLLVDGGYMIT